MTRDPATVGVVGLGNMGLPMAGHLLAAGYRVQGCDLRPEAAAALADLGGMPAPDPAAAAAGAGVVITSLPSGAALTEVVNGPHGLVAAADDLTVIETSTLPVPVKAAAAQILSRAGAVMLDCPLSGTASQLRSRDIAVYASGDPAAIERCHDVLAAFSRVRHVVGAFGNGMRMKLIANHLVAVHNTAAAEALLLAARAGLDPALALRALSDGAGSSRMLEVRGPMMLGGDFSDANIALAVFQKDIDLISELARSVCCPLPLFTAAAQLYLAALGQGRDAEDPACVYAVLAEMSQP
ncbi:MAG TPA: NAD(P)-dependent oxidoreductase [Streptosporangiaceae bacterium]|nr:NAD(P)-dependent oxidoreductase [Streptosporangiaceae bacterium]